jgi:hypothetical protein
MSGNGKRRKKIISCRCSQRTNLRAGNIMENSQRGVLTEQHLAVFGTILQCFARYELTIEQVIANVLQTDVSSIPILMRHHDFLAKRLALLDLLRDKSIPNGTNIKLSWSVTRCSGSRKPRAVLRSQVCRRTGLAKNDRRSC